MEIMREQINRPNDRYVRFVGCNRREFKFMLRFRNVGRAAFHESVSEIRKRKEKEEYNTVDLFGKLNGISLAVLLDRLS